MGRMITRTDYSKVQNRKGISIQRALTMYIKNCRDRGLAPETIDTYQVHIRLFSKWLKNNYSKINKSNLNSSDGSCRLNAVDRTTIELYEGYCSQKGCKINTIRSYIRSIRTFLYWCMDDEIGFIQEPFEIRLPKGESTVIHPYTEDDIEVLFQRPSSFDLTEWRNWAAINIFMRTGLRLSSLCELKWSDVDYGKARILVRKQKNKKQHYVPLSVDAMDALEEWQAISPKTKKDYIFFSTYTEDKISPKGLYQSIRKYNLARGLDKTSIHLMRHTFSTIYLRKGGSSDKLRRILNHETREMTDRYVHFVAADLTEDIDRYTV